MLDRARNSLVQIMPFAGPKTQGGCAHPCVPTPSPSAVDLELSKLGQGTQFSPSVCGGEWSLPGEREEMKTAPFHFGKQEQGETPSQARGSSVPPPASRTAQLTGAFRTRARNPPCKRGARARSSCGQRQGPTPLLRSRFRSR